MSRPVIIALVVPMIAIAVSSCAPRDSFAPAGELEPAGRERCATAADGETICLEARVDCPAGAFACEPAIDDPVAALRSLSREGRPLSFQAGTMSSVSRANHFQSVQRLAGPGPARFVVTRDTSESDETDIGVVEATGAAGSQRVTRGFDSGTAYTHAGGTQRVGRILVVPLERGARGSAVQLYDFSHPPAPRLVATVEHLGAGGERVDQAGAAALAALADRRYLLVVATRHARRLDFYLSSSSDLAATEWRHLDRWSAGELETAIGDRTFGWYQNLNLLASRDGALYLLGSHRRFYRSDWLDLHRLSLGDGADGRPEIRLTKVARKHLECRPGGVERCNLDAGAGVFIDADRNLRVYAIAHAPARLGVRPPRPLAPVHMMEFVGRGGASRRAARDRAAALRPGRSARR